MDVVLEFVDTFVADHAFALAAPRKGPRPDWTYTPASKYINVAPSEAAWESFFPRDNMMRQAISLFFITWIFGMVLYFVFATLSYVFIFDKRTKYHPRYLKNQISMEIRCASEALFFMAFLTAPIFLAEVRGYGLLYDSLSDAPSQLYNWIQIPFFLFFTDVGIYFIHRGLHHPLIYKFLHKPHHKWIMPTPFASHAFHPVDGWAQSLPYHIFPLLFPLQKTIYVGLFVFVNFWTIMIHDGEYMSNNPVINGAACHSLHHSKFEVNYGQFTTFADRIGGTYRRPEAYMFEKELKMSLKRMLAESKAVDECVMEVEGDESRVYGGDAKKTR